MKTRTLPFPGSVANVVCSDLDETFLPFNNADKHNSGIVELENFLLENISRHSLLFGLITGRNIDSSLQQLEINAARYPHFIASSLGTELHWCVDGEIKESEKWVDYVRDSGYKKENVEKILEDLTLRGIELTWQADVYQGEFKSTFYYFIEDDHEQHLRVIAQTAAKYNIKVLFNRCNSMAGDPENCYDIELIPQCAGKGEMVDFLMREFGVGADNVYCFGDSCNDISMLSKTRHSYLVANADAEVKKNGFKLLEKEYCHGILSKLEEIFVTPC